MEINWHLEPEEVALVEAIADRCISICRKYGSRDVSRDGILMDLIATHNHSCKLDLAKLAAAPEFDLMHDVMGIRRHLNRETAQLEGHFLPRCAAPA
ncbi:hypothetical protein [Desulfocurvus vexinensis]|uniref:DUF6874 family protein n=1 Tax=Desulfocurvus vexinensis TaxID=399548 RepID=UPI0006854689|nr:hypothetical protein [Desulfocurvus vexinensis]